ncbi:MAG TPA: hypothetical protein DCG69_12040 [Bacteroidales bacterium]|nr:hypothetical protein [Bacteroidales bacterium]
MHFEKGYIYHIYNQGNNRQKIFFGRDNYLFFLRKIRTHILPYADVLAWCLMPNHFHLMVLVKEVVLPESSHTMTQKSSHTMTQSHRMTALNESIAIMLRSYTRAINKQEGFSGSLFKAHTKAECINCSKGISPLFSVKQDHTQLHTQNPELEYPQICFNYIHQNPVKAGMVHKTTDWEFSSAKEYAGIRKGKLVNMKIARDNGLIIEQL